MCDSIALEVHYKYFVFAMCFENQQRWRLWWANLPGTSILTGHSRSFGVRTVYRYMTMCLPAVNIPEGVEGLLGLGVAWQLGRGSVQLTLASAFLPDRRVATKFWASGQSQTKQRNFRSIMKAIFEFVNWVNQFFKQNSFVVLFSGSAPNNYKIEAI